ncbi:MAG: hypothetical protein R8K53_07550 [Mariprofundaceae bacterium]
MSNASISSVIGDLFNAPLQAAVKADAEYMRIWAKWLEFKKPLFLDGKGKPLPGVDISKMLETAPVVNLNGKIDLAITMRITDVKETNASLSGGLSVGPVFASGSFGFHSESTQESLFQAAASFLMSNQKKSLPNFLSDHNLTLTDGDSVTNIVNKLETTAAGLSSEEEMPAAPVKEDKK